jgi:hypothetical protein
MRIYAVIATKRASTIADAIKASDLPNYELKEDTWLVASADTPRKLANDLGIRGGENGSGLVCLVEDYSGRLPHEAWAWLTENEEAGD